MPKIEPCTSYRVAGIRYKTKDGTFFTENQNDLWESKGEILSWDFLFEAVLDSREVPNVEFSGGAPLHGAASAGTQG